MLICTTNNKANCMSNSEHWHCETLLVYRWTHQTEKKKRKRVFHNMGPLNKIVWMYGTKMNRQHKKPEKKVEIRWASSKYTGSSFGLHLVLTLSSRCVLLLCICVCMCECMWVCVCVCSGLLSGWISLHSAGCVTTCLCSRHGEARALAIKSHLPSAWPHTAWLLSRQPWLMAPREWQRERVW